MGVASRLAIVIYVAMVIHTVQITQISNMKVSVVATL